MKQSCRPKAVAVSSVSLAGAKTHETRLRLERSLETWRVLNDWFFQDDRKAQYCASGVIPEDQLTISSQFAAVYQKCPDSGHRE